MEATPTAKNQPIGMTRYDDEEDYIDLREILFALLASWRSLFLMILVGAVVMGAFHVFLVKPSYRADAQIYITNTDSVISFSDLQLSSALTEDYSKIIKSRTVLKTVIEELGLNIDYKKLENLVDVTNPSGTHIINIVVTCDDLELARNIANALLNIGVDSIYQIIGSSEPTVIDYSEADAVRDVSPSLLRYIAIGALIGFLVMAAIVVFRVITNTTLKSEEDVIKYIQLPVLAAVPYAGDKFL